MCHSFCLIIPLSISWTPLLAPHTWLCSPAPRHTLATAPHSPSCQVVPTVSLSYSELPECSCIPRILGIITNLVNLCVCCLIALALSVFSGPCPPAWVHLIRTIIEIATSCMQIHMRQDAACALMCLERRSLAIRASLIIISNHPGCW